LLGDIEATAQFVRQHLDSRGDHLAEQARALAAADDQQIEPPARWRIRIGLVARVKDRRPHRIADDVLARLRFGREAIQTLKPASNGGGALGHGAIDAAEHGVLFMNKDRNMLIARRDPGTAVIGLAVSVAAGTSSMRSAGKFSA
jgi:hypothetical protein